MACGSFRARVRLRRCLRVPRNDVVGVGLALSKKRESLTLTLPRCVGSCLPGWTCLASMVAMWRYDAEVMLTTC